jgi:large subunit ribosomal protein L24
LGGATLQRVSGDVRSDGERWDIESLDFRAPGVAQVRLSGRIGSTEQGLTFAGPAQVDAKDPRGFVAWLTDRTEAPATTGPFRAEGEVRLGGDVIAVDRLKAEVDRMKMEGRLAYSWASGDRPARIEAVFNAPEINLDRVLGLGQAMFNDTALEWPREGELALKIGQASFGGVDAKRADVNMQFDARGLQIERLSIGDIGGAALAVKGRIDTSTPYPRGSITLDLDARNLDGIATVTERLSPRLGEEIRRRAARLAPAKLIASLTVASEGGTAVAFKVDGSAGSFRIDVQGDAGTARDAFTIAHLSKVLAADVRVAGHFDAGDGGALVELLGLDRVIAVDKGPGRLDVAAKGPLDGDMAVDGHLTAGGLDLAAKGTVRVTGNGAPIAGLDMKLTGANLRMPRPPAAGRSVETLPTTLAARLDLADGTVGLSRLSGKVAGADIGGRLTIGLSQPASVDGAIEIGAFNLPAVLATAIGVPVQSGSAATFWPAEPFETGLLGNLRGQVKVKSKQVALTPTLTARDLEGVFQFDQSDLTVEQIDGALAGGRISGDLSFQRGTDGLTAKSHIRVAAVNVGEILPSSGGPLSGQLTLNVDLEGAGRSALALIGSLHGGGTFTLQDGRIARLDPAAFDAVIRNVDQGLPIDATRIKNRTELALGNGGLNVPLAEGEIAITSGQARLSNVMVRAEGADLAVTGNVDLGEAALDAKLTLSGPAGAGGATKGRPEIGIVLKGPIGAPNRTLDVAALSSWLALRAVEQQAKRIEALESGRELPAKPAVPAHPTASIPQTPAPAITPRRPLRTTPQTPARPPRTRPVAPAQSIKPALVPPINIRPQLAPRSPQPPRDSSHLQNSVDP